MVQKNEVRGEGQTEDVLKVGIIQAPTLKVVPDLDCVRRREQRVEVHIFSRPTKVILWCDMYMFVSHMVATDMATVL